MPLPAGFRFQPIDADEVAARLVELTLGEPAGLVPDMGGPRVYSDGRLAPRLPAGRPQRRPICRCGCRARPPVRSGRAPTWLPSRPWAVGPGRSSLPSG